MAFKFIPIERDTPYILPHKRVENIDDNEISAFIFAYIAVAFSGAIMGTFFGLFLGWYIWA